jgi:hypothetical protein
MYDELLLIIFRFCDRSLLYPLLQVSKQFNRISKLTIQSPNVLDKYKFHNLEEDLSNNNILDYIDRHIMCINYLLGLVFIFYNYFY